MVLILGACAATGWLTVIDGRFAIFAVCIAIAVSALPLLARTDLYTRTIILMMVALPLQSAFVVDLGVTMRLSYVFGAAAVLIAALGRQLTISPPFRIWAFLALFLFAIFASIVLNPVNPNIPPLSESGLRGAPALRPMIQAVQLVFLVGLMVVTASFCRTRERLNSATFFVVIGGIFAVVYAMYAFGVLTARLPFIDINNAMNTDYSYGYKEQGNSYFGGYIPRPRSTFPEPANFANFLLLFMPLAAYVGRLAETRRRRLSWMAFNFLTAVLFLLAVNSRGAVFGAVGAALAMVVMIRSRREFVSAITVVTLWAVATTVIIIIAVQLMYVGGLSAFGEYFQRRFGSIGGPNRVVHDWRYVAMVFEDNPIYGVGFGNLTFYLGQLEGITLKGVADAGGLYQRLLAETGIIGTGLYMCFVSTIAWQLVRVARQSPIVEHVWLARMLFFWLVADAIQRISTVGLATDAHLWVGFGLCVSLIGLAWRPSDAAHETRPA